MGKNSKAVSSRDSSPERKQSKAKSKPAKEAAGEKTKRSKTAYLFFYESRHAAISETIKKENPSATQRDLFKMVATGISDAWKSIDAAAKRPFEILAQEDKARYEKEKGEKENTAVKGPKKPQNAYFYFAKDERVKTAAKNPGMGFADINKLIGEAWKALGDTEKKPFNDLASEDKLRYEADLGKAKMTEE